MSDARKSKQPDDLLSETYRQLSNEKAPERLNRTVLRMAADKHAPGAAAVGWFSRWTKPLAWGATIALSLAVGLELAELPFSSEQSTARPAVESQSDVFAPQDTEIVEDAARRARLQTGPDADLRQRAEDEDDAVRSFDLSQIEAKGKAEPYAASAPGAATPHQPEPQYERAAEPTEAEPAAADSPPDSPLHCDLRSRSSVSVWLECIEALRDAGDHQAADTEYRAFREQHPAESAEFEAK